MLSAVFMMFAVFGFVFALGAFVGDNDDIAMGNLWLGIIMITASAVVLIAGLRLKQQADTRMNAIIEQLFRDYGFIEATSFADAVGISIDDARDVLDKRARMLNWSRLELEHYNAKYFAT